MLFIILMHIFIFIIVHDYTLLLFISNSAMCFIHYIFTNSKMLVFVFSFYN